jgi:glycosyltransferase involved in cell wall biosynthesis
LRLAAVSPFVDRRHGTERALAELLARLAYTYKCEIHLYSQRLEDVAFESNLGFSSVNLPGIYWHKVPVVPGPHLFQFLFWFYCNRFSRWRDQLFRGASFDLVLSPGINCADADVVIVHALFHRLRELARDHSNDPSSTNHSLFRSSHRRLYYALLTHLESKIYSDPRVTLATVSSRTAAMLQQYFHRQDVPVIPHGVDHSLFSPSSRLARREQSRARWRFHESDFVLLLVGNDWGNKGLTTLLEALTAIPQIATRLLIVGDDDPAPYQSQAQRLGILDRCVWQSAIPDILDAYAAADVYVSPSREDSFAMPVAEAMACGLPAITSTFAGISSLLCDGEDSFVLADPLDAKALAEKIRMLHAQPGLRAGTSRAAAELSRNWTWGQNAAAVWELLQRAAAKKKAKG